MAITPLPPTCTLLLCSAQVLPDPITIIKELLENAIDANASSISIEISPNTIDSVQVRDNGFGINPDDRALVGKRFCTSKIRSLKDLEVLGGGSLGFRGEALSSVVSVAERVEVVTKIDGEGVGVRMVLCKDGEENKEEPASHRIGTTVRAINLFHGLPVRRQTAIKDSTKMLIKIRKLLHAYVMVRPAIRVSFKVVKAKSDKFDLVYVPLAKTPSVEDAVSKIISKELAASCAWYEKTIDDFTFQAFCPAGNADTSKVSGVGHFLSIDSRPVSSGTGPLKELVRDFKAALSAHDERFKDIKDPFFFLNVVCPAGSCDPNIEPSKTDLLFSEPEKLKKASQEFYQFVYPPAVTITEIGLPESSVATFVDLEQSPQVSQMKFGPLGPLKPPPVFHMPFIPPVSSPRAGDLRYSTEMTAVESTPQAFNIPSMPVKTIAPSMIMRNGPGTFQSPMQFQRIPISPIGTPNSTPRRTMYGVDIEDLENIPPHEDQPLFPTAVNSSVGLSDRMSENPWSLAKMSAPIRTRPQNEVMPPIFASSQESLMSPCPAPRRVGLSRRAGPTLQMNQSPMREVDMAFGIDPGPIALRTELGRSQVEGAQLPTPLPSSSPPRANAGKKQARPRPPRQARRKAAPQVEQEESIEIQFPPADLPQARDRVINVNDFPSLDGSEHTPDRDIRNMLQPHPQHPHSAPHSYLQPQIQSHQVDHMDLETSLLRGEHLLNTMRPQSPPRVHSDVPTQQRPAAIATPGDIGSALESFPSPPTHVEKRVEQDMVTSRPLRRSRSLTLPLNFIPTGAGTQNLVMNAVSGPWPLSLSDELVMSLNHLPWGPLAVDGEMDLSCNLQIRCAWSFEEWSLILSRLLREKYPELKDMAGLEDEIAVGIREAREMV